MTTTEATRRHHVPAASLALIRWFAAQADHYQAGYLTTHTVDAARLHDETMPLSRWDAMFQAGVRAHYVCSALAAPLMVERRSDLIVNISFFAAPKDDAGVIYGLAKAADDRMAACMAHDLREHNVAVSLYPGLVRTESVLRAADHFDLSTSEWSLRQHW
jgi:NAD(P)-dependent dehydrogenase (short-subunit alcohol dehydrogenase family)